MAQKELLALIILLSSTGLVASENAAMVLASRGDVRLSGEGFERPVRQGDFIAVGHTVTAANRSFAVIQLFDGAKLSVRPDSGLTIRQFVTGSANGDMAVLELNGGGARIEAGTIAANDPDRFRINSPYAAYRLMGSEASLGPCDNGVCEHSGLEEAEE